ncbi:MAG: hypothetical protein LQ346_007320 [Caloplaca aetnensis]|nr:MAG: hypothetical protein LQ346_007320 [Caloplaca aetnensis]
MADRSNDLEDLRQRKRGAIEVQGPDGKTRTVNLKDLANAYSSLAGRCGYKPVFKREFGSLATFSFAPPDRAWALLWTLFVTAIFVLPTFRHVTAGKMNYASIVLVLDVTFSAILWWISGRKFYTGPVIEVQVA